MPQTRDAMLKFLTRQSGKVPVVPYVSSFATKISGASVREFLNNAALLSKGISDAQRLLGYDAVLNIFDTTLEAEALGCEIEWGDGYQLPKVVSHPLSEEKVLSDKDVASLDQKGRVPLVVDGTRRLAAFVANRAVLIGMLTGPATLASHLLGGSFSGRLEDDSEETQRALSLCALATTTVARTLCDAGVKAVLVVEEVLPTLDLSHVRRILRSFRPLSNVLRYYDVSSIFLAKGCSKETAREICGSGLDCFSISGDFVAADLREWVRYNGPCYSGTVPTEALKSPSESGRIVRTLMSEGHGEGFFLATEWEVPRETEIAVIREMVREAKSVNEV